MLQEFPKLSNVVEIKLSISLTTITVRFIVIAGVQSCLELALEFNSMNLKCFKTTSLEELSVTYIKHVRIIMHLNMLAFIFIVLCCSIQLLYNHFAYSFSFYSIFSYV